MLRPYRNPPCATSLARNALTCAASFSASGCPISRSKSTYNLHQVNRALQFAQRLVAQPQVSTTKRLATPVANLARDDEVSVVKRDGLPRLAQVGVGQAKVAQRSAL